MIQTARQVDWIIFGTLIGSWVGVAGFVAYVSSALY
jgi:hypothetical protein